MTGATECEHSVAGLCDLVQARVEMSDHTARPEDVDAVDRLVGLSSELAARWRDDWGPVENADERLPFVEISTVSRYLIEMVNTERWDDMSVFATEIERMFAEHRFENILKVGLLESIQNTTARYRQDHGGRVTAGMVKGRLGILAQAAWEDLDRRFGNSTDEH